VAPAHPRVTRAADGELIERLRAADEHAVEELVGRYGGLVYRVAVRITGTAADAEEVTWDVIQTVWQKIAGFRGDAALSSWIYRIAANAAYGKVRARDAPTVALEDALRRPDPPESSVTTSSDWSTFCKDPAVRAGLRAVLEEAILKLPADYRTVLVLRDVEGLPNAEVADILGLSTAAVKSRTHRARLALRGRLDGFFDGRSASAEACRRTQSGRRNESRPGALFYMPVR
jgi:RNA polymerase sigma-70 factor (ECF subfamily)